MAKPIIAVMGLNMLDTGAVVPVKREFTNVAYCRAIVRAGGVPVLIPTEVSPDEVACALDACQALLLPGGPDVDPRLYGEDPHRLLGPVDAAVDRLWAAALEEANRRAMPVLGICRGLQLACAAMGGSLHQDLDEADPGHLLHRQQQDRGYPIHRVDIEADSRLAAILGTTEIYTNSMHHQCVKSSGEGLRAIARTADGITEACESADGRIILVQWHPEEMLETDPRMLSLFTDLVERARTFGAEA